MSLNLNIPVDPITTNLLNTVSNLAIQVTTAKTQLPKLQAQKTALTSILNNLPPIVPPVPGSGTLVSDVPSQNIRMNSPQGFVVFNVRIAA